MSDSTSTLLRARVETTRYRKAEKVFARLGMTTGDVINVLLAQVVLRDDLPFAVTAHPERLQSDKAQAKAWSDALGEY
jgi:addiction module RelB/DinJ family antitoxin